MFQAVLGELGAVTNETDLCPCLVMLSMQGKGSDSRLRAAEPATCDHMPLYHGRLLELNDTVSIQCYLFFVSLSTSFHSHLLWTPQEQRLDGHLHG